MAAAAPAPISTPPVMLRVRLSEQDVMPVQLVFDPMTANPTATATAPAMAVTIGPVRLAGRGAGGAGRTGTGGGGSSSCGRSISATRSMLSRASTTVQTSQVFDFV